jgi:transposase
MAVECVLATSNQNNRISVHRKRISKRQGKMKGRVASAHLLLTIVYNILKTGETYQELGPDYIEKQQNNKELKMVEYLKKKGYKVVPDDLQSA